MICSGRWHGMTYFTNHAGGMADALNDFLFYNTAYMYVSYIVLNGRGLELGIQLYKPISFIAQVKHPMQNAYLWYMSYVYIHFTPFFSKPVMTFTIIMRVGPIFVLHNRPTCILFIIQKPTNRERYFSRSNQLCEISAAEAWAMPR